MKTSRKPNSVGYFSAYYRGLECLLKMWRDIRKEVPDATLDVYYGWESWLALQGEDDFYERMEAMFEDLKDEGVTVHGRVSHEELAAAMKQIEVWAYPTEFPEIHCITALKAQEAGCTPVVTNVGALNETVTVGTKIKTKRIYTDQYKQEKFVEAVVGALKNAEAKREGNPKYRAGGRMWADVRLPKNRYWSDVAKQWDAVIKEKS